MTVQSVAEFMTPSPYTCRPEDSLQTAAALMAEHDCGCLPVVDADRRVSGVPPGAPATVKHLPGGDAQVIGEET